MPINAPVPPPEANRSDGWLPDKTPVYAIALAQAWAETDEDRFAAAAIPELPYRVSMTANRCDRQAVYALRHVDPSNPITIADKWRFSIGTAVHDRFDDVIPVAFPDCEPGVVVDLRPIGIEGSARPDMVRRADDGAVVDVVEVKTVNGFKFKKTATSFKGGAEGPDHAHVLQAALVALALDATGDVVIVYFSLENLSPDLAKRYTDSEEGRFCAEWRLPRSEWEPMARNEVRRVQRLLQWIPLNGVPLREIHVPTIPAGAVFTDPARKTWQLLNDQGEVLQIGTHWSCDYCSFRDRCIDDGLGGLTEGDALQDPMF